VSERGCDNALRFRVRPVRRNNVPGAVSFPKRTDYGLPEALDMALDDIIGSAGFHAFNGCVLIQRAGQDDQRVKARAREPILTPSSR